MREFFKDCNDYLRTADSSEIFDNTIENALPQTIVADLVRQHMESKTDKKKRVLIYGFDGGRADSMAYIIPTKDHSVSGINLPSMYSAITLLKSEGGLYLSYAGGDPKKPETLQKTCTVQGWASILTGKWGVENGVINDDVLREDCPTVLLEYAKKGYGACFASLWYNHFTVQYTKEIETGKREGLSLEFCQVSDECHLQSFLLSHIEKGTDIIFGINESPDENGHTGGFGGENPFYVTSVTNADRYAYGLITEIRRRKEYENEDWLFIITSDHGGHERTHFDQSITDKLTFIATNKKL